MQILIGFRGDNAPGVDGVTPDRTVPPLARGPLLHLEPHLCQPKPDVIGGRRWIFTEQVHHVARARGHSERRPPLLVKGRYWR